MSRVGRARRKADDVWLKVARRNAYDLQEGKCFWCAKELRLFEDVGADHPDLLTADHVIPFARGGSSGDMNIVAACLTCNLDRGRQTHLELVGAIPA